MAITIGMVEVVCFAARVPGVPCVMRRSTSLRFISRADVADFLVKQIDDDAFLHKTPVLTS